MAMFPGTPGNDTLRGNGGDGTIHREDGDDIIGPGSE